MADLTPAPPNEPAPLSPRTQLVLAVLLLGVTGLIAWHWWADRYAPQPTDVQTVPTQRVNLNRATRAELQQLPNVGPRLADGILAHRQSHGNFKNLDDLKNVQGIGDATFNKLRPWLTVDADDDETEQLEYPERLVRKNPTPNPPASGKTINLNSANLAELETLPNIGKVLAQRIIDERERKPFANVADLKRVSGIGPKRIEALKDRVRVTD